MQNDVLLTNIKRPRNSTYHLTFIAISQQLNAMLKELAYRDACAFLHRAPLLRYHTLTREDVEFFQQRFAFMLTTVAQDLDDESDFSVVDGDVVVICCCQMESNKFS